MPDHPAPARIAPAYFETEACFRASYVAETPVGFLMRYDDPRKPDYFLAVLRLPL